MYMVFINYLMKFLKELPQDQLKKFIRELPLDACFDMIAFHEQRLRKQLRTQQQNGTLSDEQWDGLMKQIDEFGDRLDGLEELIKIKGEYACLGDASDYDEEEAVRIFLASCS